MKITVGVLALQGAFVEHISLLQRAFSLVQSLTPADQEPSSFEAIEVRNVTQLAGCNALIIPGGESTTIALVAQRSGLLEPLRDFVKLDRHPTWGTCAGLILLAEAANSTKKGGQDLIGGLDVRVNRNHFGRQMESFQTDLDLPFLQSLPESVQGSATEFPGIFIRAPIVEKVLANVDGIQEAEQQKLETVVAPSRAVRDTLAKAALEREVKVIAVLPGRINQLKDRANKTKSENETGDVIAVKQGNVFGTSFHPELSHDVRIHVWWLLEVQDQVSRRRKASQIGKEQHKVANGWQEDR